MIVGQEKTDSLFEDVSKHVRLTMRQSAESIVQLSHRRLRGKPFDVNALHVLAVHNLRNRNPQKSLSILQKDPAVLGDSAVGHRIAGYAHLAQDQTNAACQHFDQAVRLDPFQSDCWTMLGHIHDESDEHDWAITYYQRAIVFDDPQHESALALSSLYARNRRPKDAIHTLRASLQRDRRSAKLNLALGKLLRRRGTALGRKGKRRAQQNFLEEARQCYQTANSVAPTSVAYVSQGVIERRLERFADAKRSFQRAVALNPRCPIAITHMANANIETGDIDQALMQLQSAISTDPQHAATHFRYSRAKRFKAEAGTDAYIAQLTDLVSNSNRSDRDLVQLNFALAKVLDDIGNYDQAWRHYDRANRLKRGHTRPIASRKRKRGPETTPRAPLQNVADNTIRFFTKEFLEANRELGSPSATPVFIVGMPRSGTTLTEQILCSHPAIAGAGELKLIDRIRQGIISNSPVGVSKRAYPDVLTRLDRDRASEFADGYLAHLDSIRTDEDRVTDKMPTNFIHLGLIALLFPRATVIHCRRNPMDVLISCYCQNLNAPFCDLEQMVHYHRQYRRMMAHWQSVLPLKIHAVDYESLVTDPEPNSRALIERCAVDWDERCLQFHRNARAVHTPSKWQVRQPMYSSSIEKWRRFEPHLRQIAEQVTQDV